MVTQQSKILFAKPQALHLLRQAAAKQANGPYTPAPAAIEAAPGKDFGLPTLPKLDSLMDMVDLPRFDA